jgi:hypothetical protein
MMLDNLIHPCQRRQHDALCHPNRKPSRIHGSVSLKARYQSSSYRRPRKYASVGSHPTLLGVGGTMYSSTHTTLKQASMYMTTGADNMQALQFTQSSFTLSQLHALAGAPERAAATGIDLAGRLHLAARQVGQHCAGEKQFCSLAMHVQLVIYVRLVRVWSADNLSAQIGCNACTSSNAHRPCNGSTPSNTLQVVVRVFDDRNTHFQANFSVACIGACLRLYYFICVHCGVAKIAHD